MKVFRIQLSIAIIFFISSLMYWNFQTKKVINISSSSVIEKIPKSLKATGAMEAMKWYNDQRAYPTGKIPYGWRENAVSHINKFNFRKETASPISWSSIGPSNIGGRVRSIAIDPNNPNVIYCGSVSGGIWKTTDGGNSWIPISDFAPNLVIGCITIDPTNSNIIYAGTGEGYYNIDALRGIGVLKSTDGGATWNVQNNFIGASSPNYYYFINRIVIRPDNPNVIFAALSATDAGVWKSTNAGASWSKITAPGSTSKFCTDLVLDSNNPNIMYASFGLFSADGVYRTTDGGSTWSKLTNGFPAASTKYRRISLSISKNSTAVVFACLSDSNYYTHSVLKIRNDGSTWTTVSTPYDNTPAVGGTHLGGQGWYNNVIAVHPTDTNIVYTGGINLFKSNNSGMLWTRISNGYGSPYVHVDQHAIVFNPINPSVMYFGCDGGIFKSTDGGSSFIDINNGFRTVQFYSGAVHPTQTVYYGGTQDNGTLKTTSPPSWSQIYGGDGGATWVDYNTPNTIYTEYVYLDIRKSTNAGSTWINATNGITQERCGFIAPFVMDPSNPLILVAGTYRVYRTTNGASSWTSISSDLTGDGAGSSGATITAIAIAKSSSSTIYVGTSGSQSNASKVWVTTNTGTNWTNVTSTLPNRYVTSIAINSRNQDSAYVAFSGYGTGHIYSTSNRGSSWMDKSGNLPDIPVNTILLDQKNNNHIIIGTDLGVFETNDGGTNWVQQNTGMANVSVVDLDMNNNGYVFAATHGRGMFKSDTPVEVREEKDVLPEEFTLNQNYPNPFNPITTISYSIAKPSRVQLKIYDISGREIETLVDGTIDPGNYVYRYDASNLASGVYYYSMNIVTNEGNHRLTKKMILLK